MKQSLIFLLVISSLLYIACSEPTSKEDTSKAEESTLSKQEREMKAWEMEERYWEYVKSNDTVSYMDLWHDDFIGYPGGDEVSGKSGIASWIPGLHEDPDLKFNYKLHKKAVNAIEDVVTVFYDAESFWTNENNEEVGKETYKLTHTWGFTEEGWVILGGMAAKKN